MKFKIIELKLFPYDILVVFNATNEEIKTKLSKFGIDSDGLPLDGAYKARTIKLPNNAVLITFPEPPTKGVFAHEIFHAAWMILDTMGVKPSSDSEEIYAYIIEYITNELNPHLIKE